MAKLPKLTGGDLDSSRCPLVFTRDTGRTFHEGDFSDSPTAMRLGNKTPLLDIVIDIARSAGLREMLPVLPVDLLHKEILRGREINFMEQYPNLATRPSEQLDSDLGRALEQYIHDVDQRTDFAYHESKLAPLRAFVVSMAKAERTLYEECIPAA